MSIATPPQSRVVCPRTSGPEYRAVPMSRDEFLAIVGESRSEWADGIAYLVMAPAAYPHNRIASRLISLLNASLPELIALPESGVETGTSNRVPDIVVIREDNDFQGAWLPEPTVLGVEILSSSTWRVDFGPKAAEYLAAGIEYYWTVDPDEPTIVVRKNVRTEKGRKWCVDLVVDAANPKAEIEIAPYGTVAVDLQKLFPRVF